MCDYWFLNVNDLLNLRWKAPYFQRPVDGERVKDIVEHYQKKLNNNIFEFISPLIVAKYDNMLYIIDGQHRFKAIEYLFGHDEKFNEDKKVPLVVIPARSMEHIEDLFQTLNKLLPLSDVYKLQDKNKKKIIVETSDYFFKKYRNFFTTKKARRPFINKNDFENFLLNSDIIDELDIIDSSTDFTFLLEKVNSFYSLQPTSFFPQKGQANFDKIIGVISPRNLRNTRLSHRGMDNLSIRNIIGNQISDSTIANLCDFVIYNDLNHDLLNDINDIHSKILNY